MQTQTNNQTSFRARYLPTNRILHGDCIQVMRQLPAASIDFILTDPPYLVNYRDRSARSIQNDDTAVWLKPAFAQTYRVLKPNACMVAFYGWTKVDLFLNAWRSAGFRVIGHLVFRTSYASKAGFLRYQHEQAYLLAKGRPPMPEHPIADVIDMPYSGNALHPTQKPVKALLPLIEAFSREGQVVLDPFCGSGSTLVAATQLNRRYLGIEMDATHHAAAVKRLLPTSATTGASAGTSCAVA